MEFRRVIYGSAARLVENTPDHIRPGVLGGSQGNRGWQSLFTQAMLLSGYIRDYLHRTLHPGFWKTIIKRQCKRNITLNKHTRYKYI